MYMSASVAVVHTKLSMHILKGIQGPTYYNYSQTLVSSGMIVVYPILYYVLKF